MQAAEVQTVVACTACRMLMATCSPHAPSLAIGGWKARPMSQGK